MQNRTSSRLEALIRNSDLAKRAVSAAVESGAQIPNSITAYDFGAYVRIAYDGAIPVEHIAAWRHAIGRSWDFDDTCGGEETTIRTLRTVFEDGTNLSLTLEYRSVGAPVVHVLAERAA